MNAARPALQPNRGFRPQLRSPLEEVPCSWEQFTKRVSVAAVSLRRGCSSKRSVKWAQTLPLTSCGLPQPNRAASPFLLDPLQGFRLHPVEVKSPTAEVVKESSPVWLAAEMVVVKQISSKPKKLNSAREIKLKQEGGEMIFIKSIPATLFLQANLARNLACTAFNRCELMFYLTVHLLLAPDAA